MIYNRLKVLGAAAIGFGGVLAAGQAGATTTATSTMAVTANVPATCSITANALAFGNYSSAQLDASTTLTVTCTNTTVYNVGLDAGTGAGGSVTTRKMASGTQTLNYSVYIDSARTLVWGQTVGLNTVPGVGTGTAQSLTVYGRIPSSQTPPPGAYADTITATVTY